MGLNFIFNRSAKITAVALIWLAISAVWALLSQYSNTHLPEYLSTILILPYAPYFIAGIMFYLIRFKGNEAQYVLLLIGSVAVVSLTGFENAVVAIVVFTLFWLATNKALAFAINPVTLWLGSISYPLYLVHRNLGYEALFKLNSIGMPSSLAFFLVLAGALILASLIAFVIEQPAINLLRDFYKTRTNVRMQRYPNA